MRMISDGKKPPEWLGTKSENLDIPVNNGMCIFLFGAEFGLGRFKAV